MADGMRSPWRLMGPALLCGAIVAGTVLTQRPVRSASDFSGHGAIGSYYGKAIELCPAGVAPVNCSAAGPALALFMTPTLTADGQFLGDDSFALGTAPFGPHTGAHGQ